MHSLALIDVNAITGTVVVWHTGPRVVTEWHVMLKLFVVVSYVDLLVKLLLYTS